MRAGAEPESSGGESGLDGLHLTVAQNFEAEDFVGLRVVFEKADVPGFGGRLRRCAEGPPEFIDSPIGTGAAERRAVPIERDGISAGRRGGQAGERREGGELQQLTAAKHKRELALRE